MKKHLLHLNNTAGEAVVRRARQRIVTKRGFTLIEILVVLGIIGALLAVGVGAIKGLSTSKGVSTAVPLAEGVFNQARQVARATGAPARVVIYSDAGGTRDEQRKRYLRMMGVATGRDAAGDPILGGETASQWRLISRPVTIPRGAYFNENLSSHSGEDSALFPGSDSAISCYVYEFNVEGTLSNDGSGEPLDDGRFVVQAGTFTPTSPPTIGEDNSARRDVGGFRVYRNGRIATFLDPNQIVAEGTNPEF